MSAKLLGRCRYGPRFLPPKLPSAPTISTSARRAAKEPGAHIWNDDANLFKFTRGRFVLDEAHQIAQHTVHFDMNELARIAASAVGADRCVHIEKCPDGLYNKAYILHMNDGTEVVGKVPNPNAGLPHYTTASEVATMDYMRTEFIIPVPKVHTWNSHARSSPVGAEYIIMAKAEGVPLSHVWNRLIPGDKLKILFLATPFPGYGSLYYAADVKSESLPAGNGDRFAFGPRTGRDCCDAGRQQLRGDRGPWTSALAYRKAVGAREQAAVQQLAEHTKQMGMLSGPGLYQPTQAKKLWALNAYLQLLEYLLPTDSDPDMLPGHLWHDDLHDKNIFVDAADPTQITAVIDFQSSQIIPLFDHNLDPSFLDYHGLDVGDNLERPLCPETEGLTRDEKATVMREFMSHTFIVVWRLLNRSKSPVLNRTQAFGVSTAGNMLSIARRIYQIGEAHFAACLLDMRDAWVEAGVTDKFPIVLTPAQEEEIKRDANAADEGMQLILRLRDKLGMAWPYKGLAEHCQYDEVKELLRAARDEITKELTGDDKELGKEFLKRWPFDD